MKKASENKKIRPLVRALHDDAVVINLRALHCLHFKRYEDQRDFLSGDPQIVSQLRELEKANKASIPSAESANLSALSGSIGSLKDASNHIVSLIPAPSCRTRGDIEAELKNFLFCQKDFDASYPLFIDAVLNQEHWPNPFEGELFTPASFAKSFSNEQRLESRIAYRVQRDDDLSFSAINGTLASREFEHHIYESVEASIERRGSGDRDALMVFVRSDTFSQAASKEFLDELSRITTSILRSFELMDGNFGCFTKEVASMSDSIDHLPYTLNTVLHDVWGHRVSRKNKNLLGRVWNSLNYLVSADEASDPQARMTLSMASLESLLSDKKTDIARAVAIRSSALLLSSHEDRENNYRAVKKLYNLRSRYLHGDDPQIGSEYLSCVSRSVAGSVLIRAIAWIDFSNRMDRISNSDAEFYNELDDAYSNKKRVPGMDSEDARDWCPLLTGFWKSME